MTEVRTTSRTGGQKGVKDERYDLIPVEATDALARVYAFGAQKYKDHNWRRRYEWSKSYAAAMRHMTAFWRGETNDPESGLPHPAHAMFHMAALLTWLEEGGEFGEFDDRYRPTEEEEERLLEAEREADSNMLEGMLPPPRDILLCGYEAPEIRQVDESTFRIDPEALPHFFDADGDIWQMVGTGVWFMVGEPDDVVAGLDDLLEAYGISGQHYFDRVSEEDGWKNIGWIAGTGGVEWRDPAPRNLEAIQRQINEAVAHLADVYRHQAQAFGFPRVNVPLPTFPLQDTGSVIDEMREQIRQQLQEWHNRDA